MTHVSIGTVEAHLRNDHGVADPPAGEYEQAALHGAAHLALGGGHSHPDGAGQWRPGRVTTVRTPG